MNRPPVIFTQATREMHPATAYAVGLICENRPDLAGEVRSAVINNEYANHFQLRSKRCLEIGDEDAAQAWTHLQRIFFYGGVTKTILEEVSALRKVLVDAFDWIPLNAFDERDLSLLRMYLAFGLGPCWKYAETQNDLRCLRHLLTLHAHTVSLDADVRAEWLRVHLNTLEPTL